MPATTFLLLVATILSVQEGIATIDHGSLEGLRPGDSGVFFYELTIGEGTKRIEIGTGRLIETEETRSLVEITGDIDVRPGIAIEFRIPVSPDAREDLLRDARQAPARSPPTAGSTPSESMVDAAVREVVLKWAAAWSDQRVDDYLALYAQGFRPPLGVSRRAWEASRRDRVSSPTSILVSLEQLDIVSVASRAAVATFIQTYRSDTYQDRVSKLLDLVREDGDWKILEEKEVVPAPR